MSKTAAATVARCELPRGGFRAVVATLLLLPAAALAANPDSTLRRSEQIDVRRLGKVSEDERSVLRIEWRAGMAGVEEARSVRDMLEKLRRLEAGIRDVGQLVRNMPATPPAAAAPAPVAAALSVEAKAPETGDYDIRLMIANLAALALVALWWFRRRRPAARPETGPAAVPQEASAPEASLRPTAPSIAAPPAAIPVTGQEAPPPAPAALPQALAEAVASAGDEAPVAASVASPQPEAAAAPLPGEPEPAAAFTPDDTLTFDFSLEAADPETVARENEKPQATRPVSPPQPQPALQDAQKTAVEPTLQLAEIMLSMGLEEGAAQTLIDYTESNPRNAIYHWLKLLGIYRSRGLREEFTVAAEKLRMHFNIQMAEWGTPAASEGPTLENFSRVAEHVQKIWTQPDECMAYLHRLLEDNREGARAGFPQSVAEEILFLIEVRKELAGSAQPAA